jgi:hypothetical protein
LNIKSTNFLKEKGRELKYLQSVIERELGVLLAKVYMVEYERNVVAVLMGILASRFSIV